MSDARESCRHDESVTIHPVSRGPRTTVECDTCGARWDVDSGMVVLWKLILDRQESIVAQIIEDDGDEEEEDDDGQEA